METVDNASLGPASSKARDLNKPGISKIFHHRVVLRIQEMLRQVNRGGLPGVQNPGMAKTCGTLQWQGFGEAARLFLPSDAASYGRLTAHSVVTLLEGTKGQRVEKVQADAVAVQLLAVNCLAVTAEFAQRQEEDRTAVIRQARDMLNIVGSAGKGRRRVTTAEAPDDGLIDDAGVQRTRRPAVAWWSR